MAGNNNNKSKSQDKNKVSEIDDQIYRHFDMKKRLGKGAYGIVWKAIDRKTQNTVAVKKIFDAFRNETDAQRTFREIMFLKAFKDHPNVIQLYSIHKATNNLDIYLAFEYMESDLHNVIKRGTILKDIHKRYVMYQLFNAIKYIHSGNVIHRDLKPSNVLIDSKCRCKIADFGLARSVSNRPTGDSSNKSLDPTEPILTDYVATRWYRAPEILIASKRYTKGIDMWSLGCILGEMIRGKPLYPGSSTVNQIEKIVASLPEINEKDIEAVGVGFGSVLLNQPISSENNPTIDDLLAGSTDDAKNLVKLLLMLNPVQRLTAKEALSHRYIEKFKNSISETELNTDVLPPFRDDVQLTVPEYRSKLYEIMQTSEMKGNDKSTGCCIKNSTKNHNTLKKKEMPTPKLDNSITVTASTSKQQQQQQSSVKISPSKLDDKLKKEYHHSRYTEKKYQNATQTITINSNSSYCQTNNGNAHTSMTNHIQKQLTTNTGRKLLINNNSNHSNSVNTNYNLSNINNSNNNNNNINMNNAIGSCGVVDTKLLKPLSKLKHSKLLSSATLPTEKIKILSSPSSNEHSSSGLLDNTNSKYRNINHYEKRHSIDCTYHSQGISPNKQHQSNTSAKFVKNGSYSNLNILNTNKSLYSKSTYNNRLAHEKEKAENHHQICRKKSDITSDIICNNDPLISSTANTIVNDANDNTINSSNNYYEKRLKLLEEKIQKQKLDIKALFSDKEKQRYINEKFNDHNNNTKLNIINTNTNNNINHNISNLSLNNSNNNGTYIINSNRKLNSAYIAEKNDNKYLKSKFTISAAHDKSSNKRNSNLNRTQIPMKYDFGHPDGNHMINMKEKELNYENNKNLRRTQQLIS